MKSNEELKVCEACRAHKLGYEILRLFFLLKLIRLIWTTATTCKLNIETDPSSPEIKMKIPRCPGGGLETTMGLESARSEGTFERPVILHSDECQLGWKPDGRD